MDFEDFARPALDAARQNGIRIATAESCTGGLIAGALTEIAGSSDVFECGFATYSNTAKITMLGVTQTTLDAHGAVSVQVARGMAEGALNRSDATLTVSVTGIAGPGGSDHKPEGRVCFGIASTGHETHTETIEFGAIGRSNVRAKTVAHALTLLTKAMTSKTA